MNQGQPTVKLHLKWQIEHTECHVQVSARDIESGENQGKPVIVKKEKAHL